MATTTNTATNRVQQTKQDFFRITDQVPAEAWYWAALGSVVTSAALFLMGRRDWSIFVGQWPPTFLLFGLFYKILHPGR